jgi:hypothetical protein
MLRVLLRWRWIHAVSLGLLLVCTVSLVAEAPELVSPPPPIDTTPDQLVQAPPVGKRLHVTCDRIELFGEVTKGGRTETNVYVCEHGEYQLPVTVAVGDDIPTDAVTGRLWRITGNEIWARKGFQKDPTLGGFRLDVYVDTKRSDEATAVLATLGAMVALWIWWVAAFLRRRRRRQLEAAHVDATFSPRPVRPDPAVELRGKLRFATALCEITAGGLDARREDGKPVLVSWSDVVGVVARQLPASHGGATFVDIVSTAGSTLRLLPWTRLTGDAIPTGDDRARALVALCTARCPQAQLDRATRGFVDGGAPPQFPDAATLDEHDRRIG